MIALLVRHEDPLSLTGLSTRLGQDLCSLSQAVNRLRKRAGRNPEVAVELERIRENLERMQRWRA
jgi:chromosome segregation and condensation protein ScpB